MSVSTHLDRALPRVQAERDAMAAKREAIDAFAGRVADLGSRSTATTTATTAAAGVVARGTTSTEAGCQAVRTAFAETVRPHSVADVDDPESLLETIRTELGESIALALAPTTDASFSPTLRDAIVAEAETRRTETGALQRALDRESDHLEGARDELAEITTWIATADETPLSALGFGALRRRHETLATHRTRLASLARDRQAFLEGTSSLGGDAGVRHRSLPPYLYDELPVDHPLLSTVARLESVCTDCQRRVRDHLVRRV